MRRQDLRARTRSAEAFLEIPVRRRRVTRRGWRSECNDAHAFLQRKILRTKVSPHAESDARGVWRVGGFVTEGLECFYCVVPDLHHGVFQLGVLPATVQRMGASYTGGDYVMEALENVCVMERCEAPTFTGGARID